MVKFKYWALSELKSTVFPATFTFPTFPGVLAAVLFELLSTFLLLDPFAFTVDSLLLLNLLFLLFLCVSVDTWLTTTGAGLRLRMMFDDVCDPLTALSVSSLSISLEQELVCLNGLKIVVLSRK